MNNKQEIYHIPSSYRYFFSVLLHSPQKQSLSLSQSPLIPFLSNLVSSSKFDSKNSFHNLFHIFKPKTLPKLIHFSKSNPST